MKNLFKKLTCVMVVAFVALSLFSCALTPQTQLKFTAFPEAEYNVGEVTEAEFLEAVKVELDGKEITLNTLKGLGATITGIHLDQTGTYTLVVNYEGVSIVFEYDVVGLYEASLNGVNYESLVEAFNEAANLEEQAEIILLKNVQVAEKTLEVKKTANIKLNLNGKLLYSVSESAGGSYLLRNYGTLEIVGSSGSISFLAKYPDTDWGTEGYPGYASNTISNYGNLTVDGDIVIENQTPRGGASYAIDNYAGSSLTVNNGTIKQTGGDIAIRMFSSSATSAINVVINGGTIIGRRAIWLHLAGSNAEVASLLNLTINGGVFSTTDPNQPLIYEYSYGNSHANTNIVINDGVFNSSSIQLCGGYKGDAPQLTVNGGTFEFDIIQWTEEGYEVLYSANK